jgi:hypothetical protein
MFYKNNKNRNYYAFSFMFFMLCSKKNIISYAWYFMFCMFCTKSIIYYVLMHQVKFKTGTSHMYQPVAYFEALKRLSPFFNLLCAAWSK